MGPRWPRRLGRLSSKGHGIVCLVAGECQASKDLCLADKKIDIAVVAFGGVDKRPRQVTMPAGNRCLTNNGVSRYRRTDAGGQSPRRGDAPLRRRRLAEPGARQDEGG